MGYVNCPMCGGPGAWEDDEVMTFCGKCEEKYQETLVEQDTHKHEEFDGDLDTY